MTYYYYYYYYYYQNPGGGLWKEIGKNRNNDGDEEEELYLRHVDPKGSPQDETENYEKKQNAQKVKKNTLVNKTIQNV